MNHKNLNTYILHYIEKDKTKNALMLTGDWGTGKSHYIQHNLIPFLKTKKYNTVLISLYGLKETEEISKNIYINLRLKKFQPKNEIIATSEYIAKTLVNGITSFFSVDLNISERNMKNLYRTINLSNKLIILEDVERSQINILDLLGYVNNLVEQDNVKVLMVVNEKEFIQYKEVITEINKENIIFHSEKHIEKNYSENTIKYLKAKEKTISDTIIFENDFRLAIKHIIKKYNHSLINQFQNNDNVNKIYDIMKSYNNFNLRSFMFACQKAIDIFEYLDENMDSDFLECVFFSTLIYSLKLKTGQIMDWGEEENYSILLGNEKYPLFKFCFNYIQNKEIDDSLIPTAQEAYKKRCLYDKHKSANDNDLETLFQYHKHYEKEVINAVLSISKRLDNINDISFYEYGTIGIHLIIVKKYLQIDIVEIKTKLINNLKGRGNELKIEEIFRTILDDDASMMAEYKNLRKEMILSLKDEMSIFPDFDYLPTQVDQLYLQTENTSMFITHNTFIGYFDVNKLAELFKNCNPEQKDKIRLIFMRIYEISNIKIYLRNDVDALKNLKELIENDEKTCVNDKIQKLQYNFFIQNLNEFIAILSKS